ncbi:hypothetical protein BPAE_0313g00040 [Botrytis paeoniae]|uniref:Anaphase-promoting complex subunit 11 RING-H2 finger domain-containing protein n=1 Tax=Botrytis paeoniae TaxID=278948 RepID=A0A4Z1FBZ9_9HELO|nr:hypothetical protein BPAE_0313g00040 [Botrytis paeoniae]
MKVKIRTWNAVATWRWDLDEDDVCGICQVHFDGTCPTCKYPGDDCSLLSGKCGHNFHMNGSNKIHLKGSVLCADRNSNGPTIQLRQSQYNLHDQTVAYRGARAHGVRHTTG